MDLSGAWLAVQADEHRRRAFPEPEFDDRAWHGIEVPGHWRNEPAFAGSDGPLLYRRRFESDAPAAGRRAWLVFEGLFYQGDVWLDGGYLGDTEGYFFPHAFEVTDALRDRAEHLLALELTCSPARDRRAKRNITGVFQHWDAIDPGWNPGGIWRPVRLEETGPVRITRLRALCTEARPERAVVALRAVLDAQEATTVRLRTTLAGADVELEQRLASGENHVVWQLPVEAPQLWWPHALGDQPLFEVAVDVGLDGGVVSDRRTLRTGLRRIQMKQWTCRVNGERLFLKGSHLAPTRMALADAPPEEVESDVVLAKEAGLDLLRVHAHVARPELYAAADRHGLLLWQDLPLQWGYARGIRRQAVHQAREAVDLLAHHPSVALWCGHDEPLPLDFGAGGDSLPGTLPARALLASQLPNWNRSVLDRSVRRALERADPTRPVVAASGVLPHPGSSGTDSRLWFGWHRGELADLPRFLAAWPRAARFTGAFGAQAVPEEADFLEPQRWPDLDWERLERQGLQLEVLRRRGLAPERFATFVEWREATQAYQAELVRHYVETLRRLKYHPAGGFCQLMLNDAHPAVTWSVLGPERVAKRAFAALAAACRPVVVVADRPQDSYRPGDPLALDVHVVSDLRSPVEDARLEAHLAWPGGSHRWWWQGDVPPDACVRVGTVQAVVPDAPGPLTLELSLAAADVAAANCYESRVER